jgi:type I restriction enzyme M protein
VKILPNESFGYLRITVERPLRLRWEITDETIAAVRTSPKLAKAHPDVLDRLMDELTQHRGLRSTDRTEVACRLDPVLTTKGLSKTQLKAVWDSLGVRDPEAPVISNRPGEPEPDAELRDQENVPLPEVSVRFEPNPAARLISLEYHTVVDEYVKTEVRPYVADAWVDHARTRIGYEVPLTRHFYRYRPPRSLQEIDAEIKALEAQIQALLHGITE